MELLGRELVKFSCLDDLERLARSLFEKDPKLYKEFQEEISSQNSQDVVATARHFIFSTIEKVIEKKEFKRKVRLPDRLENYVSFCDLHYTSRNLNRKAWHTFLLKDYPTGLHDSNSGRVLHVPLYSVRKNLKRKLLELEPNLAASVQLEVMIADDDEELFLFRVVTFVKLKNQNPKRVETKLCKERATFYGIYPGEPYIYSNSEHPDELHLKAWVEVLHCTGITTIPLKGKNLEDLRKMRLLKSNFAHGNVDGNEFESQLPVLQEFNLLADSRGQQTCVQFKGKHIFAGFEAFLRENIFIEGVPTWVNKAKSQGRNSLRIVRKKSNTSTPKFDEMSIAASDFTMIG